MNANPERKYLAVSIKHSLPSRGYQMTRPLVLWGRRTEDDATRRSFGGYTMDPEKAELYTIQEWITFAGKDSDILPWQPVKCNANLLRNNRNVDSALVEYEDYMNYYRFVFDPERS